MARVLVIIAVLIGLVGLCDRAIAQEAAPAPACAVEAPSIDAILAIFFNETGTPIAGTPVADVTVGEDELPQGEPADAETIAAVDAVVRELSACFDTDRFPQAFALITPRFAIQLGFAADEDRDELREALESLLAGTPEAGDSAGEVVPLEGPRDVRVLEDGRVGGIWSQEGDLAFIILIEVDGRWLADEFIDVIDPDEATPVT